jgi:hypothetical protein
VHSRALSISRILAACLLVPAAASATFHEVKIVEVFPGTVAQPNAQYVVLQAWAGSQNFVDNHSLFFFDHTGAGAGSFTFDHNMANGANQMKMFVATAEASALFGSLGADLVMTPSIDPLGGKVCWDVNNFDCMAWGNYAGSSTGVGRRSTRRSASSSVARRCAVWTSAWGRRRSTRATTRTTATPIS